MNRGVLDEIAARRQHQIAKGYDAAHDDEHDKGEIAVAAAVYTLHPFSLLSLKDFWPWDWTQFRPKDRRENLIDAAAMLVAEIERLDRIKKPLVNWTMEHGDFGSL